MKSPETSVIDNVNKAIALMLQGALYDAREALHESDLSEGVLPTSAVARMLELIDRISSDMTSKEVALAKMQTVMWELETAQSNLRKTEARYRTTLASIGDGLISTDLHGCVDFMNPVAEQLTGWSTDEARERPIDDVFRIIHAQTRTEVRNPVARSLEEGIVVELANHVLLIARDGTEIQIADSCAPIREPGGRILGAVLVFRDITEKYRRLEQLRESEDRYRAIVDGARDGILVADSETRAFLHCNKTLCEMFGYSLEEVLRLNVTDIHPEEAMPRVIAEFEAQARGEKKLSPDLPCRRKDGSVFFADIRTTAVRLDGKLCNLGFFTDISERKEYEKKLDLEKSKREKAEVELRHAQKLQAVGQLAAGIAHEINTPVQFVSDSVHFLSDSCKDTMQLIAEYQQALASLPPSPEHEALREEMAAAEQDADIEYLVENAPSAFERSLDGISRISTIVGAMKEFAHPDQREKSPADLNQALQATLVIAKNEYKYVATVETELGEIPPVFCHVGDLNQVFLNLLVNASHAIEEVVGKSDDRGRIVVRTAAEGDKVRIEISDTGNGITEEIRDRLFEPFFTTKEVGLGSGQGLAIAHSIVVEKHGGSLTFKSEVGKGTTFCMLLPIEEKASSHTTLSKTGKTEPRPSVAATAQDQQ